MNTSPRVSEKYLVSITTPELGGINAVYDCNTGRYNGIHKKGITGVENGTLL